MHAGTAADNLCEQELANFATVFYNCPELAVPDGFARSFPAQLRALIGSSSSQHFGMCVRFLAARSHMGTPQLWEEIEAAWLRYPQYQEPMTTVAVVWGIATAGAAALRLHRALGGSEALGRVLRDGPAQWLANLSWACATSEVGLPSIFGPVCDAAVALLGRAPRDVKMAELSSLMWGVATSGFHVHPSARALFEAARGYLAERELEECDGQSVCNLLWTWAVADMREHRLVLRKLHTHFAVLHGRGRIIREGLSQAHQYQLWVQLELRDDALLFEPPLRQACRDAMEQTHRTIHVSGFQGHVARVLSKLGVPYQLELNLVGYSVDLALPGPRVAIEVDGPHHFLYDFAPGKDADAGTGCRDMALTINNGAHGVLAVNGASTLKHRLLRAMGWRMVSIPFYEFEQLRSALDQTAVTPEMMGYVSTLINPAET